MQSSQVSVYTAKSMDSTSTDPSKQEKKPVPKFSSFKFPQAPPPEADRSSERHSREAARREEKSRHRSSRHRSHRDRSRSRERRREHRDRDHRHSHRKDVHTCEEVTAASRPVVKEAREEDTNLFIIDVKGDRHNLLYGTLHRYSVPAYHRIGRGSVIGLPRRYKIDRETEGNTLVLRTNDWPTDSTRLKSKNILAGLRKQKGRLLRVRPEPVLDAADAIPDYSKDYLPLNPSAHRKRRDGLQEADSEDERYAYRSIHGKAKPEQDIPSDVEAVSETDSEDEGFRVDLNEEIKQTNVELSRKTEESPSDVGAWLRLIDHQGSLLSGAGGESRPLTYAERTSLADIKISLYEKALKKGGQKPAKERLLLGLLEEGAKLWDTKKLSAKWQSTLRSNSQFIGLWIKYLDFRQTQFVDFTYERCLVTFLDCLKLNQTSPNGPEKVYVQNYLFLRLTLFIREAGFTEHAVGLWQSILELTFLGPEGSERSDRETVLSDFMAFWETEAARIGEPGAKGWKSESNGSVDQTTPSPMPEVNPKSIFKSWMTCERERMIRARLPARSLDELEDDDPYRVIISSDLQEILFLLWESNSAEVLIDSFLYFCHLPPLTTPQNAQTTSSWAGDSFLRNEFMSNPESTLDDWFKPETNTENPAATPISFPHPNFIQTLDTLFAGQQTWFSSFKSWINAVTNPRSDTDPDWVRRSLRLLVEANPTNDDLAEYTLALEFTYNPKESKKLAKSLLKKRSSSLRLYNAYALMECRSGNHSAAEHVWATALSMSETFAEQDKVENGILWRTWIWELLEARETARMSHLLLALPQQSVDLKSLTEVSGQPAFSATNLLKIHSFLSEAQEHALASRKANVFVAYTDCLAVLLYLSQSLDLEKSVGAYSTATRRLATLPAQAETFKSFTTEVLHQSQAKLIYHHVRKGGAYKPSHIRALLAESISLYPHNTMFLSLFAWNESRNRIEERVRGVIRDITTTQTRNKHDHDATISPTQQVPVTSHLFSIYTELSRPVYAGSTLHSVRAAFEKAIGDPSSSTSDKNLANTTATTTARSNLSLWKLYILFELSRHEIQRAKDVFYRGMRACPWSKELIMLAFTHLRTDVVRERYGDTGQGMGFDELRWVYNVLVEKELRIHVDVEGMLDDIAVGRQGGMQAPIDLPDDESGDE